MSKEDIEMIEHAKALMKYCEKHENCKGCVFDGTAGVFDGTACELTETFRCPKDWTFQHWMVSKYD